MFIDTHCHLDFPAFQPEKSPIPAGEEGLPVRERLSMHDLKAAMKANGVTRAVCISVSLEAWDKVFALAQQHEEFYCTVGVHPDYEFAREPTAEVLIARAKLPKVVAIGECGLDFYQQPQGQIWQEKRFENHLLASRISQKPLVIHSRDSGKRMLEMLKFHQASPMDGGAGGVLHCFTDTWEIAKGALDMGFYLSFSGIVTFKNAKALHEVAKKTPEDRFVIETDSPYLAPHPHRGKLNHPALVLHVAEHLSQLRGVPLVDIAKQSTLNAERLFRLPALGH